jgi:undecaprenyl diphosphate synthase
MYIDEIDKTRIPQHVAIIMDGNGRWAKARGMQRSMGHQAGLQKAHEIMETAVKLGIRYMTLYTFSTENWNRPADEVAALMTLLMKNLEEELFMKHDARFKAIGEVSRLPKDVQEVVHELENRTRNNKATCMVLALSYSSRWEITNAMRHMAELVDSGRLNSHDVDEQLVSDLLATEFMPDPELVIRTGGEQRLSNFLLWQAAYSEFYFTPVYWPDFGEEEFCKAIADYQHRQRRFGKTGEQVEDGTTA